MLKMHKKMKLISEMSKFYERFILVRLKIILEYVRKIIVFIFLVKKVTILNKLKKKKQ